MTSYLIRTDLDSPVDAAGGAVVLDWAPGTTVASIECGTGFFNGWRPTRAAADLLVAAAAAYCADKTTARAAAADAWTRDIELHVPVADPHQYDGNELQRALGFLTGDRWTMSPYAEPADPLAVLPTAAGFASPRRHRRCLAVLGRPRLPLRRHRPARSQPAAQTRPRRALRRREGIVEAGPPT